MNSNRTEYPHLTPLTADNLREAPLEDLLLYGLTLGEDDPALGVLLGVRRELGLIVNLAEQSRRGADFDLEELVPVLESVGRRLDVAIELFTRAQPAAPEATEPEGDHTP